jgi:hypothetical protein
VTPILIAPRGGPVDACWHEGRIVVAYQDGPGPDAMLDSLWAQQVGGRAQRLAQMVRTMNWPEDVA